MAFILHYSIFSLTPGVMLTPVGNHSFSPIYSLLACYLFILHLNADPDCLNFILYNTINSHRRYPFHCLLTDYRL
jgi:hypothetical protein